MVPGQEARTKGTGRSQEPGGQGEGLGVMEGQGKGPDRLSATPGCGKEPSQWGVLTPWWRDGSAIVQLKGWGAISLTQSALWVHSP